MKDDFFLHVCFLLLQLIILVELIWERACRQTSKGDGWTAVLRAELTASPFSLTRGKQTLEGESIFISSPADGGRIDIKGDCARGKEGGWKERGWGLGGREAIRSRSKEQSKKKRVRDWGIIGRRRALRMKRAKWFRWSETWSHEGWRSADGRRRQKLRMYKEMEKQWTLF